MDTKVNTTDAMLLKFSDESASKHHLVGGKGANLGLLTRAGFSVPSGFTVTTAGYAMFLRESGLAAMIQSTLARLQGASIDAIERETENIRQAIQQAPIPAALATAITAAYRDLDDGGYVAVRSSGTAEDLASASFAGLHDTYLDVRGSEDLLNAVRACWASFYSARAVSYRMTKKFNESDVGIAVVVQRMVESEVSGVMFTGNPLTTMTDEIVINASWGLGEAVVQGMVGPDQYVVKIRDLRIKEKILGSKQVEIVRDQGAGRGVIQRPVEDARQKKISLSDDVLRDLANLGRRVMDYYEGYPQDIEWGVKDGKVHLLQSRPITGVDFSWDLELEEFEQGPDSDEYIWTRVYADELWTGAITPLFFSWRAERWVQNFLGSGIPIINRPEMTRHKYIRYYKGESYTNIRLEELLASTAPPMSRADMMQKLPPERRDAAFKQPFSYFDYLQSIVRAPFVMPKSGLPYNWMRVLDDYIANRVAEAEGLPDEALKHLSDSELKRYIQQQINFEHNYNNDITWPGFCLYFRDSLALLRVMVANWYDGANDNALAELLSGSDSMSATVREHIALYDIARGIATNTTLLAEFRTHPDASFFDIMRARADAKDIVEQVDAFLASSGHRGHSDRDIYFPRYRDDLGILHRSLEVYMKSEEDPREMEKVKKSRRDEALDDVVNNLRRKPFGGLKAEALKLVLSYVSRCFCYRDDERHFIDRNTYSIRKAFIEVGRRVRERGHMGSDRDFWFLSRGELYAVLDGQYSKKLIDAKVAARMNNFDRFHHKEWKPPKFICRDMPMETEESRAIQSERGLVLHGLPTSRGVVTGTARVITALTDIGRVNNGEILVANSTDPGWTPVFAVLSGVVVETGGLLSHSSCLAREYGFPAAQIEGAVRLIPDGATITVDGNAGNVLIHNSEQLAAA